MAPIKKKKRIYYTLVALIVFAIVGGLVGTNMFRKYQSEKGFADAVVLMDEGLKQGDYPSLNAAEMAIREEAKRDNPRAAAVAHAIILRSYIWFAYTGEPVLMSDCRKYLEFLQDPEGLYHQEPIVALANAVYNAVNGDAKLAQDTLGSIDAALLAPGQREFWLGVAHWSAVEMKPAEDFMRKAIELSDCPHHRFGLARVLHLQAKGEEAAAEYRKVIEANPAHHAAEAYLLLLELKPDQDHVSVIEGFFSKYEGQVEARIASDLTVVMANALALRGDEKQAKKVIQQAKVNDPGYDLLLKWKPPTLPGAEEEDKDKKKGK